jgi:hypothetical protein
MGQRTAHHGAGRGVAKDGLPFATASSPGKNVNQWRALYAIRFRGYVKQFTMQGRSRLEAQLMWLLFQSLIIFAVVASKTVVTTFGNRFTLHALLRDDQSSTTRAKDTHAG